jgi:hypothetical protein
MLTILSYAEPPPPPTCCLGVGGEGGCAIFLVISLANCRASPSILMGKKPAKFSHLRACLYVCTIEGESKGSAESENSGYVVFKLNSAEQLGDRKGATPLVPPTPSTAGF